METMLLTTEDEDIKKGAEIIKNGGLVAFPTETVYGLGADAFDPNAAKKAYAAKGRPSDNPLIVHIAEFEDIKKASPIFDDADDPKLSADYLRMAGLIKKLSDAFWPGPLTMIVPKRKEMPLETTGGLDTVALRMPRSTPTLKLIKYSGTLISGPSANLSGRPSPTSALHVKQDLDGKIDAIIMGDPCEGGIESTVLDLCSEVPTILRPGLITPEMISAVTGTDVEYDKALFQKPSEDPNYRPKAPGQKYKHYAPKAEMLIVPAEKLKERVAEEKAKGKKVGFIQKPEAKTFFAKLREFDLQGVDMIIASPLPEGDSLNFSIMNRVLKSAGYHIEE